MSIRDDGIQAIIDLQAEAGIEETKKQAAEGWDAMSLDQQEQTILAHRVVCKNDI
jgi:hypothetical protein